MADSRDLRRALQRAARDLRRRDEESSLPYEHLDAVRSAGGDPAVELGALMASAAPDELASLMHLARLLKVTGLEDDIASAALRRPAPLAAKAAAVRALQEAGHEIPAAVSGALEQVREFVETPDRERLERVLSLPEAWRQPALAAWAERSAGRDTEVAELLLDQGIVEPLQVAESLAAHGDADAAPLLQRLGEHPDKAVVKAAKRALHQLRARGVEIDAPRSEEAFSLQLDVDVVGEALGYVTGVDGMGGRIVWALVPTADGGHRLLEAVLDDVHGLRKAELLDTARRDFRAHMRRLEGNESVLLANADPRSVAGLLQSAEELNRASDTELPAAYAEFRDGPAAALLAASRPWAPESPGLPDDENERRDLLREAVELLGEPYFSSWAVLGEASERAASAVRNAETSELLVDDDQRKKQIDDSIAAVAAALGDDERARYGSRLREMAAMLARHGRERDALRAVAAADGFHSVAALYSDHPFARAIVQRGVMAAYQHLRQNEPPPSAAPEPESPGRIVQP